MRLELSPAPTRAEQVTARVLPTDGNDVLMRLIDALAARVAKGERCAIVWDIDGTLVDTRRRMLAALHAYGRTDITLADLRDTAPPTSKVIAEFGLDAERFTQVWSRVFWDPALFTTDVTIPATLELMRRAAKAGIANVVMTGRNDLLGAATATDLRKRGVPFDSLFCKRLGDNTAEDKTRRVDRLRASGVHIGAFVTDAARELIALGSRLGANAIRGILVAAEGAVVTAGPELVAHVLAVPVAGR